MGKVRMGSVRLRGRGRRVDGGPAPAGVGLLAVVLAGFLAGCADAPGRPSGGRAAYAEIVAEEDARGEIGLERVRAHLDDDDGVVRAMAVRALGRLEDRERIVRVGEMLGDPDPAVRTAAAAAMAQSVYGEDPGAVLPQLAARIGEEADAEVVGSLATNLGRLAFATAEQRLAGASALVAAGERIGELGGDRREHAELGLMRGIEAFARSGGVTDPLSPELAAIARAGEDAADPQDPIRVRIRRLAAAALTHGDRLGSEDMARLLADADWGVRRQALIAVAGSGTAAAEAIPAGLGDPDPRVRVEALRAHAARVRPAEGCGAILAALDDPDPDVVATALDLLATPCPRMEAQREALASRVAAPDDGDWRGPARALHALAAIAPGGAGEEIRRIAAHANPFARAWAARAAGRAGEVDALRGLAGDEDPNVREAALQGLGAVAGGGGRDHYLAALESDDPQLVMTAARLIVQHVPGETSVSTLLTPLARFTDARRETERDVRVALLEAVGAVGGFSGDDLAPYLADYDPVVAGLAAALLTESTGTVHEAAPERLPRTPPPDASRIAALEGSRVVLHMAGLGEIVIALRPDLAATNADRFARLAREGYFDGLTFHRVVPNFVIQGGSPHANEYMGDGPYSRDEISDHPHWRGTVGLSTRGRDTGDAQIFINLVDNVRLDFNYTIYGEVVEGMEIADAVQEGGVIERAEVITR